MRSDKLVNWLQVIGNFGLIAGLGLVAIQIQQNTDITRAQMISEDRDLAIALKLAQLGENPAEVVAKSIDSPDQLTTEDMVILSSLHLANYYHKSRNEMLHSMGFGVEIQKFAAQHNNAISTVNEFIGTPYGLALWETWKNDNTGGPYANGAPLTLGAIDTYLEGVANPGATMAEQHERIRANLVALQSNGG